MSCICCLHMGALYEKCMEPILRMCGFPCLFPDVRRNLLSTGNVVDKQNLHMAELFGGETWLLMSWLWLLLLAVICVVSLVGLFRKGRR